MPKFSVYFEIKDWSDNDPTAKVAHQNKLNRDTLQEFVRGFLSDYDGITIQFDTESKIATVVPGGKGAIDDYDNSIVVPTPEDIAYEKKWRKQITEHQRHIDETVQTLKKEDDKKSEYAKGLFKFIEDERRAIKEIEEYLAV